MVGVPKSTGCATCRKRKIKCDETWPQCMNCQIWKHATRLGCPGPPARHTFKSIGAIPTRDGNKLKDISKATDCSVDLVGQRKGPPTDKSTLSQGTILVKEDAKARNLSPHESAVAIWNDEHSSIPREPALTKGYRLAHGLMTATTTGAVGGYMHVFKPFFQQVSIRLGNHDALDAATVLLILAQANVEREAPATEVVSPKHYVRAVQALQACIDDPLERTSPATVCAATLLGATEVLSGPHAGNTYFSHVRGGGRLMEIQGPKMYEDSFSRELIRFTRGHIIMADLYERRPCFLDLPEWKEVAFTKEGQNFGQALQTDFSQAIASLPTLYADFEKLKTETSGMVSEDVAYDADGPDGRLRVPDSIQHLKDSAQNKSPRPQDRIELLWRLQAVKDRMFSLGSYIDLNISVNTTVVEVPASEASNPNPTTYKFTNWHDMSTYACFWATQILTNKLLMRLLPPHTTMRGILEDENRSIAGKICKTWEDTWLARPIGAFHTNLSYPVAYEYCEPEVKRWLLDCKNRLLGAQRVTQYKWTEEFALLIAAKMAGEDPGVAYEPALAAYS